MGGYWVSSNSLKLFFFSNSSAELQIEVQVGKCVLPPDFHKGETLDDYLMIVIYRLIFTNTLSLCGLEMLLHIANITIPAPIHSKII